MTTPDITPLPWFDALPDPALLVDLADEGRVRHANPAATRHFGHPPAGQLLATLWPDLADALTPDAVPTTVRLQGRGSWRWVDVRSFPVGGLLALQLSDATTAHTAEARSGALYDLTVALSRALTASEAAGIVLRQGLAATGASSGTVFTLDDHTTELTLQGYVGYDDTYMIGWQRVTTGTPSLLWEVIRDRTPRFQTTAEVDARYAALSVQRTTPVSVIAAIPLVFGGRVLGVVSFGFGEQQHVSGPETLFVLALAENLAQALMRAQLFDQERRTRDHAARLYRVTAVLMTAEDETGVLEAVVAHGIGEPDTVVGLVNVSGTSAVPVVRPLPPAVLATGHDAAQRGQARYIPDSETLRAAYPTLATNPVEIHAVAAVPFTASGQSGALVVTYGQPCSFDPEIRTYLDTLAAQVGQALSRVRLLSTERQARTAASRLSELTAALAATRTPADVAQVITQTGLPVLGAAVAVVWQLDVPRDQLLPLGDPVSGVCAARQVGVLQATVGMDSVRTRTALFLGGDSLRERVPALDGQAVAALPLHAGERIIGALACCWEDVQTFDPLQRSLLLAVAGQCAVALERLELAGMEREQAHLLDLAQDAVITRTPTGEVTSWNVAAQTLYGYTRREALGQPLHDLLRTRTPGPGPSVDAVLHARGVWAGELIHITRDGHEVTVASQQNLRRDESGRPVAIMEIDRNVTDQHAAQEALRVSEARYRALIEATNQYVWTNSAQGEMTGDQPGWARLTGQTATEYQGFGWAERLHPDDRAHAVQAWQEAVQTSSPYQVEQRVQIPDGTYRSFLVRGVPLLDASGVLREWVGLHTDITELRRAEAELRAWSSELERRVHDRTRELHAANEELSAFAYTASHDLRAPLRHISGFASILRRSVHGDEKALRYVDIIEGATVRMEALIDALLVLARSGSAELHTVPVDLTSLVTAVQAEYASDLQQPALHWRVGRLPVVHADAGLLRQVLVNLLGNAVKFSRLRERPTVEIWAETRPAAVVVSVRDNGAGFDPRYAAKLFGVFQRLHHADEFEGTGIGLANVKRIVEKHGGQVWAEGHPDQGATFSFSLPHRTDASEHGSGT